MNVEETPGSSAAGEPDWDLVQKIRTGNDEPFNVLMERYKRPILNFIYRMTGDSANAEDISQDVFVRAYQGIHKASLTIGTGKFSTWLFQIAHNAVIDTLRRQTRRPTDSLQEAEKDGQLSHAVTTRTADKDLAEQELGKQIAAAVSTLPPDQKTAIILSEYHDMSYAEIADIMKCSEKSVEARLYRAKQTLRQQLAHLLEQQ